MDAVTYAFTEQLAPRLANGSASPKPKVIVQLQNLSGCLEQNSTVWVYDESGKQVQSRTALDCRLEVESYGFVYGKEYSFRVKVPGYRQVGIINDNKFVMEYGAVQNVSLEPTGPWGITFNVFRSREGSSVELYGIDYTFTDKYGNKICAGNTGRNNVFSCESRREFENA